MHCKSLWFQIVLIATATLACNAQPQPPLVQYSSRQPVGRWLDEGNTLAGTTSVDGAGSGAFVALPTAGSGVAGTTLEMRTAGTGTPPTTGGAAGGSAGRAGIAGNHAVAGSAGSAGSASSQGAVASLSFDLTTSPVGYRYQPKNVGAIWVQDGNGKLVKSLEVWAQTRRRYLTRYTTALSGSAIDVTASATLTSHKTHHATWNMKDRTGAVAPAGKYTLVMELTDGDQTGRTNTIDFDTSAGPQTMTPAAAPSFTSMKLQLQ
jgi:hypothetical protein